MENEFDFKNIGKKTPYCTPDGFFQNMQEQLLERAKVEKIEKRPRMKLIIAAALAVAAMLLGLVFFPAIESATEQSPSNSLIVFTDVDYSYSDAMDVFIEEMPDDELEEWAELSEYDVFMN